MLPTTTNSRFRLRYWITALLLAPALTFPALAGPQFMVALHGYDPVAYFTDAKPVPGDLRFVHFWNGANWIFSSEANQARFATDPSAYAPQFDGYRAYAASLGDIAPGGPRTWRIVEGKLYVNFNARAEELWKQDIAGNIAKANQNWPRLNPN